MLTVRVPARTELPRETAWDGDRPSAAGSPAGELADLYAAILVVVPLVLLLRWLWP